eukprot:15276-Heterococcus_DN1.PRE.3
MHVWRSTRALLVLIVLTAVAFANFAQAFDEGTKTTSDVQSDWQSTKGFLDEKFYYQERLNMGVPFTHRKLRSEGLLITADFGVRVTKWGFKALAREAKAAAKVAKETAKSAAKPVESTA